MSIKRGARTYLRFKAAPVFVAFWVVAGTIAWAVLMAIIKALQVH